MIVGEQLREPISAVADERKRKDPEPFQVVQVVGEIQSTQRDRLRVRIEQLKPVVA